MLANTKKYWIINSKLKNIVNCNRIFIYTASSWARYEVKNSNNNCDQTMKKCEKKARECGISKTHL
jgi:hypothetical protein